MTWEVHSDYEALAKRCEETDGYYDDSLDCDIALLMLGGEIVQKQAQYTGTFYFMRKYASKDSVQGFFHDPVLKYTGSMDAAYSLVPFDPELGHWNMVLQNHGYVRGVYQNGNAVVDIHSPLSSGGGPYFRGNTKLMAAAISAAGLRAHGFIKRMADESSKV